MAHIRSYNDWSLTCARLEIPVISIAVGTSWQQVPTRPFPLSALLIGVTPVTLQRTYQTRECTTREVRSTNILLSTVILILYLPYRFVYNLYMTRRCGPNSLE